MYLDVIKYMSNMNAPKTDSIPVENNNVDTYLENLNLECCNIMKPGEDIESLSSMSHVSNTLGHKSYHDIEIQCQGFLMESKYMLTIGKAQHHFLIITLNT